MINDQANSMSKICQYHGKYQTIQKIRNAVLFYKWMESSGMFILRRLITQSYLWRTFENLEKLGLKQIMSLGIMPYTESIF